MFEESRIRPDEQRLLSQVLSPHAVTESVVASTEIYSPNQAAQAVFSLESGQVGLFLRSDEGRSLTLAMLSPGALFGHVALTDEYYDAYAIAQTDARITRMPTERVRAAAEQDARLGMQILEEIGRYRQAVSHSLDGLAFKSVPARLASLLLDMARNHGGQSLTSVPRHSHRQLAEMINAYRETVTKVINQFRAAHLLEIHPSTITLLNLRYLEELAQS